MRRYLVLFVTLLTASFSWSQKTHVYFFPGQGADERLFSEIDLDTNSFQLHYFSYPIPHKKTSLKEFALKYVDSINQEVPYVLIGTSMGGMICSELTDTLSPEKTIIISSAKERNELPHRYRFQRYIPLYAIVPKRMIHMGAKIMQPLVEPDSNKNKEVFSAMLSQKDPKYMKRSVRMIINWEKKNHDPSIIHIHGEKDNTLPIKYADPDIIIENGSHMMTLTRGQELSKIINELLPVEN